MSRFVSRSIVLVDGAKLPNIKNVKIKAVTSAGEFKMMDGTGTFDMVEIYGFTFDAVLPKVGATLDWKPVLNGKNAVIELVGGPRVNFTNLTVLSRGEITTDGEKEVVCTIDVNAEGEMPE